MNIDSSRAVNQSRITEETDTSDPPKGGSSVHHSKELENILYRLRNLEKQVQELYYLYHQLRDKK